MEQTKKNGKIKYKLINKKNITVKYGLKDIFNLDLSAVFE
jgi:hypothetical protein